MDFVLLQQKHEYVKQWLANTILLWFERCCHYRGRGSTIQQTARHMSVIPSWIILDMYYINSFVRKNHSIIFCHECKEKMHCVFFYSKVTVHIQVTLWKIAVYCQVILEYKVSVKVKFFHVTSTNVKYEKLHITEEAASQNSTELKVCIIGILELQSRLNVTIMCLKTEVQFLSDHIQRTISSYHPIFVPLKSILNSVPEAPNSVTPNSIIQLFTTNCCKFQKYLNTFLCKERASI